MKSYLQLVRIPNLLFFALAQFLMRQAVIVPILQVYGFSPAPPDIKLYLLILATVCIAAGGYVLNDYFDVKTDAINRPDRLIVTRSVSKTATMRFYQTLTATGVSCGLILAFLANSFTLAFIFIVIPGLLWFYSANYKRQFMIGNLVASFCASLSLLVVAITEISLLQMQYGELLFETDIPKNVYGWAGGFAAFAFLLTWIKELIKDMENEAGDREMECRTMPIRWGMRGCKLFITGLIILTITALAVTLEYHIPFGGTLSFRYMLIGIIMPLIVLAGLTFKSNTPAEYHQSSTLAKAIMLTGMFYSLIFYYLQAKTYGISLFGLFIVQ